MSEHDLMAAPERFRQRVRVAENGCWLFVGYVDRGGYGRYNDAATGEQMAHRFSYRHFVGEIPNEFHVDHLCCEASCVNPSHLEPVSPEENRRRQADRQTHCKRGHELTEANTQVSARGQRSCKRCRAEAQRAYRQRRKSLVGA